MAETVRTGASVDCSIVPEAERTIRAELLLEMLINSPEQVPGKVPALRLKFAHIVGDIDLRYASVEIPIRLAGCRLDEPITAGLATLRNLFLRDCDVPSVDLVGATIATDVDLTKSRIPGGVFMGRTHVLGSVRIEDARIGTDRGTALGAWGVRIGGNLFLREGLTTNGEIKLLDGQIGGLVDLSGATLRNRGGVAFDGCRLHVTGPIICRDGLSVEGAFFLRRARVGSFVDFRGAQVSNPDGASLFAPVAEFNSGFTISNTVFEGTITLSRARISGGADLSGARIHTREATALQCADLEAGRLTLPNSDECHGAIDLSNAHAVVVDAPIDNRNMLHVDGLSYDDLQPLLPAVDRIRWLAGMEAYRPQPYEQLAAAYRRIGHDADARRGFAREV